MTDLGIPGRTRSLDQEVHCEHLSTFGTVVLTVPLFTVAAAMLYAGDFLHVVYALMSAVPAVGFIALALLRERTVLPAPAKTEGRKPGDPEPGHPARKVVEERDGRVQRGRVRDG